MAPSQLSITDMLAVLAPQSVGFSELLESCWLAKACESSFVHLLLEARAPGMVLGNSLAGVYPRTFQEHSLTSCNPPTDMP